MPIATLIEEFDTGIVGLFDTMFGASIFFSDPNLCQPLTCSIYQHLQNHSFKYLLEFLTVSFDLEDH